MKFEIARIHFCNDVFASVAVVISFRPSNCGQRRSGFVSCLFMQSMSSSYKSCYVSLSSIFQTELEDAADLVLFLMDHTFLADDHLALNETTFTWPDRIMAIIKMRYIYIYNLFSKLCFFAILGLQPRDLAAMLVVNTIKIISTNC